MCKLYESSDCLRLGPEHLESMFLDDLPLHEPCEYVENMGRKSWAIQFVRLNDNTVNVTWIHDEARVPTMTYVKFRQLAKKLNNKNVYLDRCEHGFMTFAYSKVIKLESSEICLCCFVKQMKNEWFNIVKQAS